MLQPPPPQNPIPAKVQSDIEKETRANLEALKWRAINFLAQFAFVAVVYTAAILTDYYLFWLIGTLLRMDDATKYLWVLLPLEILQVSTVLSGVALGFLHLGFAIWGQIRLELELQHYTEAPRDIQIDTEQSQSVDATQSIQGKLDLGQPANEKHAAPQFIPVKLRPHRLRPPAAKKDKSE